MFHKARKDKKPNFANLVTLKLYLLVMNRRYFFRLFIVYLGSAIAIPCIAMHKLYEGKKAKAGIPVSTLITGTIVLLDLLDKALNVGEKLRGLFKIRNDTNKTQSGNIVINIFNSSNPSSPEVSITKNITISPRTQETYQLPPIELASPGAKILQVTTGVNSLSTTFRYGSFCCDSGGNRRCPVPYSLNLGTECLCSGQGEGRICE